MSFSTDLIIYMKDLPLESKYDQEHVYQTVFQMSSHAMQYHKILFYKNCVHISVLELC